MDLNELIEKYQIRFTVIDTIDKSVEYELDGIEQLYNYNSINGVECGNEIIGRTLFVSSQLLNIQEESLISSYFQSDICNEDVIKEKILELIESKIN